MDKAALQRAAEEAAYGIGFRMGVGLSVQNVGQFYALVRPEMINPDRLEIEQEYGRMSGESHKMALEAKRKKYAFHWRDGQTDYASGETPEQALIGLGFGAGALSALEYWEEIEVG